MTKIICAICCITASISISAQTLKPITTNIGKLSISIDPRMELLGVIQTIADYPIMTKDTPYSNEIKEYFSQMKDSRATSLTKELFSNGFGYDAPVAFMLYHSQPPIIKNTLPYSQYLIERARGKEKLDEYNDAITEFAKESKFTDFWDSKEDFYKQSIALISNELNGIDPIKIIEDYYKDSKNSYNIVICPLFWPHSYGAEIENKNGKNDIYSLTCTHYNKDNIPYIDKKTAEYLILHEFSHTFVNPLTEKHKEQVKRCEKLFEPIKGAMSKQAYGNWVITLNEHIIRAFTARMAEITQGKKEFKSLIQNEYQKGFLYVEPIVEILKSYEKERDVNGVTFAQYFPTFLSAIEKLDPMNIVFNGPINNVLNASKLTFIYPTVGNNASVMADTKLHVFKIADFIKQKFNKECKVIPDSTALNTQLDNCGIYCYGTIQSNLFLSHHSDTLPFHISDGKIQIGDKEYDNLDLRVITCIPNPQNNKYGMAIYTALKDENIININNFKHGARDYHIFGSSDRGSILKEGNYDKSGNSWEFIK